MSRLVHCRAAPSAGDSGTHWSLLMAIRLVISLIGNIPGWASFYKQTPNKTWRSLFVYYIIVVTSRLLSLNKSPNLPFLCCDCQSKSQVAISSNIRNDISHAWLVNLTRFKLNFNLTSKMNQWDKRLYKYKHHCDSRQVHWTLMLLHFPSFAALKGVQCFIY